MCRTFKRRTEFFSVPSLPHFETIESVKSYENVNGNMLPKVELKVVEPRTRLKGLSTRDFDLQNLVASGASDLLREMPLMSRSPLSAADNMESQLHNINTKNEDEMLLQSINQPVNNPAANTPDSNNNPS